MIGPAVAWALGLLRTPAGRAAGWLLAALAVVGLGYVAVKRLEARAYGRGEAAREAVWQVRLKDDREKAAKEAARQAVVGREVGEAVAQRQAEVRTVTETLIKEIPVYVTVEADRRCDVPAGFVRLHDAAAAGLPAAPDPAGQSADAPSGVALSAVGETVVGNYGACREAAEQLKGWQDWWGRIAGGG